MLYQITFKDGSTFLGGNSLQNSKWNEIPEVKEISSLTYVLPDGNIITLHTKYEAYNHLVEVTQDIYGGLKGKTIIRAIYLMGLKNNIVTSYRISLFELKNSKYKIGDITRREYEFGKEYYGKPSSGWKKGSK